MALVAAFETKIGIDLPSAYISIASLQTSKLIIKAQSEDEDTPAVVSHSVLAFIEVFASQAARESGKPAIERLEKAYSLDPNKPVHEQVYEKLAQDPDLKEPVIAV